MRRSQPGEVRAKASERKPQEERWAELIQAATDIFFENGYDGATLQDIATRVGILKGSIYYYIDSKAGLLAYLLSETHKTGRRTLNDIIEANAHPLRRLDRMMVGHVIHVCHHVRQTAVFLREVRHLSPEDCVVHGIDRSAFHALFSRAIQDAMDCGLVRAEVNPALAGFCMLSSLNSVYTWFGTAPHASAEDTALHMASVNLRGLMSKKGLSVLGELKDAQTGLG